MNTSQILEKYGLTGSKRKIPETQVREELAVLVKEAPAKDAKKIAAEKDINYDRLLRYKKKLKDMKEEERTLLELVLLLETSFDEIQSSSLST
jgi:hypothetical protein